MAYAERRRVHKSAYIDEEGDMERDAGGDSQVLERTILELNLKQADSFGGTRRNGVSCGKVPGIRRSVSS